MFQIRYCQGRAPVRTTIAAFLCAMLDGYPLLRCIQLAAAQGASCVASYGALDGICSLEELNTRIERGWAKRDEWIFTDKAELFNRVRRRGLRISA